MGSSSLETSSADYQVFLSFRGPDTRQGFADCLYHYLVDAGVRVFRDNEGIGAGEKINVILSAINNSKVCIPIFSKGYASSRWCLDELSEMIKLKKIVMPVFFDVSPDDVKLKTNIYVDALSQYGDATPKKEWEADLKQVLEVSGWKSNPQDPMEVQEQVQALKQVVKIKGWELKNKGYAELSKSIVEEVLNNLQVRDRIVSDCLVGTEDQVDTVMKLLDMKAAGVRYVSIHGIGGSGKTSLAKVVFNQFNSSFEHRSFLSDVRDLSERHGINYLQKQLLADFRIPNDISSSDEGMKKIHEILKKRKVLIVLDDVDKREQIENLIPSSSCLASGSRFIITTRDERVVAFRREFSNALKMDELDTTKALKIFSMHTFGLSFPPLEYLDLSKEVVLLAGHLPLHLEIAGSYLRRKNRQDWNTYIAQLRKIPEKEVQEKLMLTYNTLDIRTKQIFLDIACFFVNKDKNEAINMWEACDFLPELGIQELISKSLVKVIDGNKLWMHDFVRDLGRDIVCQENLIDSGECSRLWIHEKALGVLERKEGTRKIQALRLSTDEPSKCFTRKNFKNLINLRFLEWSGSKIQGKFEHIFSNLTWLSWHNCPPNVEAEMLNLVSLIYLDLSGSDITEDWEGWSQANIGCNLKVLNLTNCKYLVTTPDLSKFTSLEKLILNGCSGLTSIGESISMLAKLKHLNLTGCRSLIGLPEEMCCLESLEEIFMVGRGEDQCFYLPECIGNLSKLIILELSDVRINELPESICKLKKLERLVLYRCVGVTKFPEDFGDLESLVSLDAYECRDLSELPDSVGSLKQLKVLNLQRTQISQLPSTIGTLEKLEELNANYARKLSGAILPEVVERLSRLTYLDLSYTAIEELPSLINLSRLQTLRLIECNDLVEVPELPTSLTELEVTSFSVENIATSSTSISLVYLSWACPIVGWPWSTEQTQYLSTLFIDLWHLKEGETNNLSNLNHLSYLKFTSCFFKDKFQCLGVGGITSLMKLQIVDCDCENLNTNCLPENLEQLDVWNCRSLTLLDVSHIKKLKRLDISNCKRLQEIVGQESICGEVNIQEFPSIWQMVEVSVDAAAEESSILEDDNYEVECPSDGSSDMEDEKDEAVPSPKTYVSSDIEDDKDETVPSHVSSDIEDDKDETVPSHVSSDIEDEKDETVPSPKTHDMEDERDEVLSSTEFMSSDMEDEKDAAVSPKKNYVSSSDIENDNSEAASLKDARFNRKNYDAYVSPEFFMRSGLTEEQLELWDAFVSFINAISEEAI